AVSARSPQKGARAVHGGSAEAIRCPGGRAQCNAAGSIGSIGRVVARKDTGRLGAVNANASEPSMQIPPIRCLRQELLRGGGCGDVTAKSRSRLADLRRGE